ncbi:hypothetical protein Tco_0657710 [Tanacetum coccineum]
MSYSEMLDMLVYKLECEIRGLCYCIPRNRLEIGLTLVEGDFDMKTMYDMAELYGLINLYIAYLPKNLAAYYFKNLSFVDYHEDINYKLKSHEKLKRDAASMIIDELVSWEKEESHSPYLRTPPLKPIRKRCDWIDKRVGYDDRSLLDFSKAEFSKEPLLDDGRSSSATSLSFVLKWKGESRVMFTRKVAILKRIRGLEIPKQFTNRLYAGNKCRLPLPENWCNDFYGFLICVVVDDRVDLWSSPDITINEEASDDMRDSISIVIGASLVPLNNGSGLTDTSTDSSEFTDDYTPKISIRHDWKSSLTISPRVYGY